MKNLPYVIQQDKTYVIKVSAGAEVPTGFRPGGRWSHLVEQALSSIDLSVSLPWRFHYQAFEGELFNQRVVPVDNREVRWGVAALHRNLRNPQPSPFVQLPIPEKTPYFSLELFQRNGVLFLERLYHGKDYTPPLPWQPTASRAPGGVEMCAMSWQHLAFVHQPNFVRERTHFHAMDETPPDWARKLGWR